MAQFAQVQSITQGDYKITFLADGGAYVNPNAMYPASADKGWGDYGRFLDDQGRIIITIGGFLIESGDRKIIMDLGFGPATVEFPGFGPFIGGGYLDSFAQTGVAREDITDVVYTHLHLDHVGWTTIEADGQRQLTFPNARHMCAQAEWDFWMADESGMGPNPDTVANPLKKVIQFVKGGDELAPGITVLSTPGHTPGHISLHLDAGDTEIYMIADLLHSEVQFYEADWHVVFDIDPAQGRQTRESLYPKLAQPNVIVADGHFADKVFGRLTNENGRWQWNPLN